MSKFEVLLCIYDFLDKEYFKDKNKSDEYMYYISNINPDIWAGEGTADPAYYADYLRICDVFFEGENCSVKQGFGYAQKYLEEYNKYEHTEFSSNIDEVVEVFSKCTLSDWERIYESVKTRRNR